MNKNRYSQDWNNEALTKFPKIEFILKNDTQRQRNIHGSLLNDIKMREEINNRKTIESIDQKFDMKKIMNNNVKYRTLKRNRKPVSTFLERNLVNKIVNNVSKISKIPNYDYTTDNFARKVVNTLESKSSHNCHRYEKNSRLYEENQFQRIFASVNDQIFEKEKTDVNEKPANPDETNDQNKTDEKTEKEIDISDEPESVEKIVEEEETAESIKERIRRLEEGITDMEKVHTVDELIQVKQQKHIEKQQSHNERHGNRADMKSRVLSPIESIGHLEDIKEMMADLDIKERKLNREDSLLRPRQQEVESAFFKNKKREDSDISIKLIGE